MAASLLGGAPSKKRLSTQLSSTPCTSAIEDRNEQKGFQPGAFDESNLRRIAGYCMVPKAQTRRKMDFLLIGLTSLRRSNPTESMRNAIQPEVSEFTSNKHFRNAEVQNCVRFFFLRC